MAKPVFCIVDNQPCLGGGVHVGVCLGGVLVLLLVAFGGLGGVLVHIRGER